MELHSPHVFRGFVVAIRHSSHFERQVCDRMEGTKVAHTVQTQFEESENRKVPKVEVLSEQ